MPLNLECPLVYMIIKKFSWKLTVVIIFVLFNLQTKLQPRRWILSNIYMDYSLMHVYHDPSPTSSSSIKGRISASGALSGSSQPLYCGCRTRITLLNDRHDTLYTQEFSIFFLGIWIVKDLFQDRSGIPWLFTYLVRSDLTVSETKYWSSSYAIDSIERT